MTFEKNNKKQGNSNKLYSIYCAIKLSFRSLNRNIYHVIQHFNK